MENDIEKVLVDEQEIQRRLDGMALELEGDFPGEPLLVVVLLKGALVFAADLLRRMPRMLEIECLSVASYHGGLDSCGVVSFLDRELPDVRGRRVLVLDDILDTGRTLRAVVDRLLGDGALEVRTGVLLAKAKRRAADVEANYVGFHIADEFVVGYGLDYRGRYRNLPYVGVLGRAAR
ncbi:MAG: hypoxanthine phosphoribosyltransferase [Verrucomicrobia bacterium]|nr:MAG: hypoxanthine phosphoribosyltransferase [Verrucomicrobiota bacterium]TAE87878.1 MAG: hypoxanthine phosphoribosyltransferase [Verrucomicrobiota bacterium]TAF25621.1 MAG: hypoxanthine phosphoribosyltransferase [Verrucomicrobiota bacterium]TAF41313.1 MAG: hypoxanthine phosphoribosyltransferase [Verrucomicrobiota bacterium]